MSTILKIAIGTAILAGIVILVKVSHNDRERRLTKVADEGYETAHDILYPTHRLKVDKRLHYGPVLPS